MSDLEDKIAQIMGGNFSPNPSPVVGFRKVGATLSKFDSASDANARRETISIPPSSSTPNLSSDQPTLSRMHQSDPALDQRDSKLPPSGASVSTNSSRTVSPVNFERGSGPKVITRKSIAGRSGSTPTASPVTIDRKGVAAPSAGIADDTSANRSFSFQTNISPIDKDSTIRSDNENINDVGDKKPSDGVSVNTLLFGAASPDESVDPLAETVSNQIPKSPAVISDGGYDGDEAPTRKSSLAVKPNTEPLSVSASDTISASSVTTAEPESGETKLLQLMGKLRSSSNIDLLENKDKPEASHPDEVQLLDVSPGDLPLQRKGSRRTSQVITLGPKPSDIKKSGSFTSDPAKDLVTIQKRSEEESSAPTEAETNVPLLEDASTSAPLNASKAGGFGAFAAAAAANDLIVPQTSSSRGASISKNTPELEKRKRSSTANSPSSKGGSPVPSAAFKSTTQIPSAYAESVPKTGVGSDDTSTKRGKASKPIEVNASNPPHYTTPTKGHIRSSAAFYQQPPSASGPFTPDGLSAASPESKQSQSKPVSSKTNSGAAPRPVKVAVRVRPFSSFERQAGARRTISKHSDNLIIVNPKAFDAEPDTIAAAAVAMDNKQWAQIFRFDHCLWSYDPTYDVEKFEDQIGVHKAIGLDMVENALNGVSTSCFAYGHTSTGKTYSLFGPPLPKLNETSLSAGKSLEEAKVQQQMKRQLESVGSITPQSGLIQRVFHDIIRLAAIKGTSQPQRRFFVSFLEIYNDKIRDLLAVDAEQELTHAMGGIHSNNQVSSDALKVREHPVYGPYVESLKKIEVTTPEEALLVLQEGQKHRSTAQTAWNALSSRSHAVVTLELSPTMIDPNKHFVHPAKKELFQQADGAITSTNRDNIDAAQSGIVRVQMIDLAGSEKDSMRDQDEEAGGGVWTAAKVNPNPASTPGKSHESFAEKEKNELRMIRRSLSTLGFIIKALVKGASLKSLPYRDCVLTFLLRDSLNGRNYTTMLSTISPSHTCYDETLSTLRYAERLCKIRPQKTLQSSAPNALSSMLKGDGKGGSSSNSRASSPSRVANDRINTVVGTDEEMNVSRNVLLEEFEKIHEGLGRNKPGTEASRRLLKETISDPQQRIARMTKVVYSTAVNKSGTASAAKKGSNKRMIQLQNGQYINPMDGSMKPLSELTDADLEDLKNSYRTLTSELIELQIDLDSVRTDRDSMMVELKSAQDMLGSVEQARADAQTKTQQLTRSVKAAEKELDDLHVLLRRKEETVDRLLVELGEEKQARLNAEQAYHLRTKEFLTRFEAIKKENKALSNSVDSLTEKYQSFGEEKKNMREQLDKQKESIRSLTAARDASELQVKRLQEDSEERMKLFGQLNERASRVGDLEQQAHQDKLEIEKLRADVAMLCNERDSLMAMVAQKDSLMQIQSQQSEMSIKMLQQRQAALEQTDGSTHPAAAQLVEFNKLQMTLSSLFLSEEAAMQNEVLDVHLLIGKVKELRNILEAARLLERQLDNEKRSRFAAEKMVEDIKAKAMASAKNEVQLKAKVAQLKKEMKTNQPSSVEAAEMEVLRQENTQLREQLRSALNAGQLLQHANHSSSEGQKSQDAMQNEFNSLWQAVQELNKLDALKDKSIESLREEKDKITADRDAALERLQDMTKQYTELNLELQEIDRDLIFAVQNGGFHPSASGGNHSIVLSHVTDRMMQGLAKRHEANTQLQPVDSTPVRASNFLRDGNQLMDHSSISSYGPGSAQSSRASTPAVGAAGGLQYGIGLQPSVNNQQLLPPQASNSPYSNYHHQQQQLPPQSAPSPYSKRHNQQQGNNMPLPPRHQGALGLPDNEYVGMDEEEKGTLLSEEILERQIEELSDFLVDESKLKRMRQRTNSNNDLLSATKKKVYTPKTKLSFEY